MESNNNNNKVFLFIALGAVVAVVILALAITFFGPGKKDASSGLESAKVETTDSTDENNNVSEESMTDIDEDDEDDADEDDVDDDDIDEDDMDEEDRLEVRESLLIPDYVVASSELAPYFANSKKQKLYTYFADYVSDLNLDSAWNEGVDGTGVGETLDFIYEDGVEVTGMIIYPGFYVSEKLFFENCAVSVLEIQSGNEVRRVNLEEIIKKYSERVDDKFIRFDKPLVLEDGHITAKIVVVRSGNGYSDTCISELWFVGHGIEGNSNPDILDISFIHDDPTKYVNPSDYPNASIGPSTSIKK